MAPPAVSAKLIITAGSCNFKMLRIVMTIYASNGIEEKSFFVIPRRDGFSSSPTTIPASVNVIPVHIMELPASNRLVAANPTGLKKLCTKGMVKLPIL